MLMAFFLIGLFVAVIVVVVMLVSNTNKEPRPRIEEEPVSYRSDYTSKERVQDGASKLPWALVGVLSIVLVVGLFYGIGKVNTYDDKMSNLESNISQQNSDIWSLRSQVNILNSELHNLKEEQLYVDRGEYTFVSVTNEGTGIVDVVVFMNRLPVGEDVTLVIEDQAGNSEEVLMTSETMTFQTSVELDLGAYYTIYIMVEADGEYIKEEVMPLNMEYLIRNRMGVDINEDWDQDGMVIMFEVYNNYELNPNMAFEHVRFEVYYDDVLDMAYLYSTPSTNNGSMQTFYHEVHIPHEEEARVMIKIIGEDGFGNTHVLFEEGWWN
jgi:cell division protein FtsL